MFETTRECTLTRRNLACSIITNSENAVPKTTLVMDPWCNCEKQEYQDISFPNNSDLWHQHNQCECWSITKRDIFKLVINILLTILLQIFLKASSNFLLNSQNFIQSTVNNKIHILHIISINIFQEKVIKTCIQWK